MQPSHTCNDHGDADPLQCVETFTENHPSNQNNEGGPQARPDGIGGTNIDAPQGEGEEA